MVMNVNEVGASLHVTDELFTITKRSSVAVAGGTLAIPLTHNYVAKTTGGVEALTLANGKPGQVITIALVATGGNGTLTPATCSGFATIVFTAAGDNAALKYLDDTVGWVILGTAGVLAPPVLSV